jgi:hypothetical protein
MDSKVKEQKVSRRSFMKGTAAAAIGGLALTQWAASNFQAAAATGQAYLIVSDVIRGSGGEPQGPSCVETNFFRQGEQAVFRVAVFESASGRGFTTPADNADAASLKVTVTVEGESPIDLTYGAHPGKLAKSDPSNPNLVYFWTTAWPSASGSSIAPNVSGKLKYTIDVTGPAGSGKLDLIGADKDQTQVTNLPASLEINSGAPTSRK